MGEKSARNDIAVVSQVNGPEMRSEAAGRFIRLERRASVRSIL
jgi:hypothetical protein